MPTVSNNSYHRLSIKPELTIESAFATFTGPGKHAVTVTVKNNGPIPATNVPVELHRIGDSGTLLKQWTIPSLAPANAYDVTYEWDTRSETMIDRSLKR